MSLNLTFRPRTFCALALLLFAGCANPAMDKTGVVVNKGDYEMVTPLGSNIPVMIKKGTTPATASPTDTISADEFAQNVHRAGGQSKPGN